jgi:predicted acyltransferase
MLLGELLMSTRPVASKMKIIGLVGISGVVFGWALNPVIPIVMKLWTTSYGLATAGFACLMFAPVVFVHPLRVVRLRLVTLTLTGMWCAAAIATVVQGLPEAGFLSKAVLIAVMLMLVNELLHILRGRRAHGLAEAGLCVIRHPFITAESPGVFRVSHRLLAGHTRT